MIIEHAGKRPAIDRTASIAPDATVCGDVVIGAGARILHGARIIGEDGGAIRIGRDCIVMENAVIRASRRDAAKSRKPKTPAPIAEAVAARLSHPA